VKIASVIWTVAGVNRAANALRVGLHLPCNLVIHQDCCVFEGVS
jgi:hypothetical protein